MELPSNSIILIAGVPGSGKSTISYELLNTYDEIRIIEETDIIREILLGYNEYLLKSERTKYENIYTNDVLMTYDMAASQCEIMKHSLLQIIKRQQRKGIPTIINGVHIVPEILCPFLSYNDLLYITLYLESEAGLRARLETRNQKKYTRESVPLLYEANKALAEKASQLSIKYPNVIPFNTETLSIDETVSDLKGLIDDFYCINT